jgi:chromate reductase, NAD(P)H dehydrogenase (quinone)
MIRIVAISGSLRKHSLNTALLQAAIQLAPLDMEIQIYKKLAHLPLFNPDLEESPPSAVLDFRSHLQIAQGIVIASPEYIHGITGALKNALDWIAGSGELVGKMVCLINTSSRATHAYQSLEEILRTMDAKIVPNASKVIGLPYGIDKDGILGNPQLSNQLREALALFELALTEAGKAV